MNQKNSFKNKKSFENKSKGFLFTISVILFASTLVFFAQSFSTTNNLMENAVFSNLSSVQISSIQDDLAFDLLKLSGLVIDVNYGSTKKVSISGTIDSSNTLGTDFSDYSSFLSETFFARTAGTETLDLSNISDGSFELFFGSSIEFDYNYDSNSIYLNSLTSLELEKIDLNFFSSGSITSYEWSEALGDTLVDINYYDDTNYLHFTKSINPSEESTLTISYSDGTVVIYLGAVNDNNNSFAIESSTASKINYSFDSFFAGDDLITPLRANSIFSYSKEGISYSNNIVLIK